MKHCTLPTLLAVKMTISQLVNDFLKAQIWLHGALALLAFVLFFLLGNFLNK